MFKQIIEQSFAQVDNHNTKVSENKWEWRNKLSGYME